MTSYVSDAHAIIIRELERYTQENLALRKRVMICCPFHPDRTPSMIITLDPRNTKGTVGSYFCFGCKASTRTHGGWNGLADKLGLANTDAHQQQITTYVRRRPIADSAYDETDGWELDALLEHWNCGFHAPWPVREAWRTVPGWLMRKLGAWIAFDERTDQQVCVLPQWNGTTLTGAVKARTHITARTRLKYISAPGPWVLSHALYPFHLVQRMLDMRARRDIFLVEGPRDAIRLIGCGIPALALLGTNNWSDNKRDLLLTLDPDRVFLAFDHDHAGEQATRLVLPTLKGFTHRIKISFKGDGKVDPGNVPLDQIREWKRHWRIETTRVRDLPDHY